MKLASLKTGGRDGTLIVVSHDLSRAVAVPQIAPNLQAALDRWAKLAPGLHSIYEDLNHNRIEYFALETKDLAAPLPRAYQWLDGSAYLTHVERVRKARGADMPASFLSDPLMYQGNSAGFLGPCDPIQVAREDWGVDFEAEIAVVTDDVPKGVTAEKAGAHIVLLMLVNDVSLRNLIPPELAKGFGFLHGKPGAAFSPVAVTPDDLGADWADDKVLLPINIQLNHGVISSPLAGHDMQFNFAQLIAHAARTRPLPAGTIIGSGTISNADSSRGCACIVEQRVLEQLTTGNIKTEYLRDSDRIRIEMLDAQGQSIFGAIDQEVQICQD
jgi:fumarylacetoacetate (FAA) hydrolase